MAKEPDIPDRDDEARRPGPDPERLKIDVDFDEAGRKLVNKPKPDHWPDDAADED